LFSLKIRFFGYAVSTRELREHYDVQNGNQRNSRKKRPLYGFFSGNGLDGYSRDFPYGGNRSQNKIIEGYLTEKE
jgi:hypothetical protein